MPYGRCSLDSPPGLNPTVRLCIKTPAAGGRVMEAGQEQFLLLAHEHQSVSALYECDSHLDLLS